MGSEKISRDKLKKEINGKCKSLKLLAENELKNLVIGVVKWETLKTGFSLELTLENEIGQLLF